MVETSGPPYPTIPTDPETRVDRQERVLRRLAFTFVSVVLLAAGTGFLGVRTDTVRAEGSAYALEVEYSLITRPGLASPFVATVEALDGQLPDELVLRFDHRFLEMLDQNGLNPVPAESSADGSHVRWTFNGLSGQSEFEFQIDARLEPAVQWGRTTDVAVEVGGEAVAEARFSIWVLP